MKKIFTIFLISIFLLNLVLANNTAIQTSKNKIPISINSNKPDTNNETDADDSETEPNRTKRTGLGQMIRRKVKAGVYTSESGEQIKIRELAQNRLQLIANGSQINCNNCNITQETIRNRTKLKARLSNGRNAEIKIMPKVASQKALQRLKLKVCSEENNCTIELKEVGRGNKIRFAYETRAKKAFRLFRLFKIKRKILTQIDAETGEEIATRRPWWSFLATEREE